MTSSITSSWPKLTSRQEFEFLADLVMSHPTGDHTFFRCAIVTAVLPGSPTTTSFKM